jgi:hypothetical protein
MTQPFKIESANITLLSDIQLTQLLKELLHAEAYKFGLAQRSVEVALNIRVGDGGEDGRVSWDNGPDQTDFIPNRLTMFQNKATEMAAAGYANEIMTSARPNHPSILKPKVEEILDQGGTYVVFTIQELNTQQKTERISAIRQKLREQGKAYSDTCEIYIYDASQIAGWTNMFISTVVSVQHWIGRPVERGLKTYSLWSEHEDLSRLPFADVASRSDIVSTLAEKISEPKSCFRIMGLSGLGKTRTAFQIFNKNEAIRNIVVYVDASHGTTIDALVSDWVGLGFQAILVVDNCDYRLHERLTKEVRRTNSQISLLSLDYNFDTVSSPTVCFRLNPMADKELLQLLSPLYKDILPDLDRVVGFAQGFPQMAVLLADARLNEDPRIGELTEDELANKLLWKRGEQEDSEALKILQACSLFDVFGIEQEVESQLEHIASIAGLGVDEVFACVQKYSSRGLIDRRGRFGQVVPKPLAIRLAGQWWTKTRHQKQRELVNGIPEGMVEGFCHQVEKLDFHSEVKQLTERLCGPQGPFGQAEAILSVRGSRLFRAFVNVNPDATCAAIYRTLINLDSQELSSVSGDTRRNLVWSLEMLCYHADLFMEAAWCMLLLASAENETWNNNATGMFSQLFRIHLSGTASEPKSRFALLRNALNLHQTKIDMVVLDALTQAVSTHGGTRAVGAEYQGTKPPLEEWRPKLWQEIFDYWQEAFDLLLCLFERGEAQREKVLADIGHSIRGFVSRGRISMLDAAINHIVEINGRYWPEALESIKHVFEYDSEGMKQEVKEVLNKWLELLDPAKAELPEKLKILVINPPWEHFKGEDGHYIDVAAENSKVLAAEIAPNVSLLIPHLNMLLQGEQRQSYPFGRQLALELAEADEILELSLERILIAESVNINFILGIYRGIFEKSPDNWQAKIDKLLSDTRLVYLYPEVIRTGEIKKPHLNVLLDLIRNDLVPQNGANALSYGSVTDGITPPKIAEFCLSLSQLGDKASWSALSVIYMYCFRNKGSIELIRHPLKILVTRVPFHKELKGTSKDAYQWHDLAKKLLKVRDEELAIALTNQLICACQHGFDYGDIWHYTKPLLTDLMRDYGQAVWPIFGDAIVGAEGMERYWLQHLLESENSFSNQIPSVLSVVPVESIISWCKRFPDLGPLFVSNCVNILETVDEKQQPSMLFIALLANFGGDDRVAGALSANFGSRSWSGSLIPYLEADRAALIPLLKHENFNVSRWIKRQIDYIDQQIEIESIKDAENDFGIY